MSRAFDIEGYGYGWAVGIAEFESGSGESRGLEVHDEQPDNLLGARVDAVVKDVEDSSRVPLESVREEALLTVEAKPPPPRAPRVTLRVKVTGILIPPRRKHRATTSEAERERTPTEHKTTHHSFQDPAVPTASRTRSHPDADADPNREITTT
ncbi:hypothetical protein CCMSSC00406_0010431 [Pleurotus cornucopiae]|uniref:Uncharacterized protein n=1 Tax=Pleurotus cornucopiae TaxID=5321 RepID=A0ACB7IPD6_PLECO|nr:hypothetical protein CCMSSC00406_0010431 [Pleurotus cornucopiae]